MTTSKKVANVHEWTSIDGWRKRLWHPTLKIVHHLVNNFSLPTSLTKKMSSFCHLCSINKAHQQPFRANSLQSHEPLELIYTNVCRVLQIILPLMDPNIILFLLIITQNIYGSIQWS